MLSWPQVNKFVLGASIQNKCSSIDWIHNFSRGRCKVTIVKWWMWHFGGATAKRHYAVSNSWVAGQLDRGVLSGWKKVPPSQQTAKRYRDKSGKSRYQGTSQLRKTEMLDGIYVDYAWCYLLFFSFSNLVIHSTITSVVFTRFHSQQRLLISLHAQTAWPAQGISIAIRLCSARLDPHHEEVPVRSAWCAADALVADSIGNLP